MRFMKTNPEAIIPTKKLLTDAGYDLYSCEDIIIPSVWRIFFHRISFWLSHEVFMQKSFDNSDILATKISTGIALEIPEGQYGRICDRSGLGSKLLHVFAGCIDSSYRGEILVCLVNFGFNDYVVKKGDRVAQIVFEKYENHDFVEVESLSESDRGNNGFGSSGK
jgi:dUTP pyrophosphatase